MGLTGNLYLGMKYERQAAPSDSFTVTGQLTAFYAGRHHFLHFLAIGKSFHGGAGGWGRYGGAANYHKSQVRARPPAQMDG